MRGHTSSIVKQAALAAAVIVFLHCEVLARGDHLSGRIDLTYQNLKAGTDIQELFAQRYQATLRDKVFETNELRFTLFYDDFRNLSDDQTLRRYRGQVDLKHKNYTFFARVAPKQKVTPVQLREAVELAENRMMLDVHPRNWPRVRLSYDTRQQYFAGEEKNRIRDLRGELFYNYRWLDIRLKRFENLAQNAYERQTSTTGGRVGLMKAFKQAMTANASYEYQLTETTDKIAYFRDVSNHTLTGVFTGRYRRLVSGTLSLQSRLLETSQAGSRANTITINTRNDNFLILARFFPQSPAKVDLSRTYQLTEQNMLRILNDYYTAQLVVDGEIVKKTTGRIQLTQRYDAGTENGIVPPDIYFLSLRSEIRRGVDLRAEFNILTRNDTTSTVDKYSTSSVFDLFLRPTKNLQVSPSVQYVKFAEQISFTKNSRSTVAIQFNYYPVKVINVGGQVARTKVSKGQRRVDDSANLNLGFRLRSRAQLTLTYGYNQQDIFDEFMTGVGRLDSESHTFNVQAQVWVNRQGSISLVYTSIDRRYQENTNNVALNYRQNF